MMFDFLQGFLTPPPPKSDFVRFQLIPLLYKESPDSTNFVIPGNRTIEKSYLQVMRPNKWFEKKVFCFQNVLTFCEKIVLVTDKNFWNSKYLQNFWDP